MPGRSCDEHGVVVWGLEGRDIKSVEAQVDVAEIASFMGMSVTQRPWFR